MNRTIATLAATGAALCLLHSPARATVRVDVQQQGPNVVASYSGNVNLDSFSALASTVPIYPLVGGIDGFERLVLGGEGLATGYAAFTSAAGGFVSPLTPIIGADASAGDTFGLIFVGTSPNFNWRIALPLNYSSGDPLSGGATWSSRTLAGLGLNPGTYTFTWGQGANVESLELQIGAAPVPEPATLVLMLAGIAAVGTIAGRRGARPR